VLTATSPLDKGEVLEGTSPCTLLDEIGLSLAWPRQMDAGGVRMAFVDQSGFAARAPQIATTTALSKRSERLERLGIDAAHVFDLDAGVRSSTSTARRALELCVLRAPLSALARLAQGAAHGSACWFVLPARDRRCANIIARPSSLAHRLPATRHDFKVEFKSNDHPLNRA